MKFCAALLLLLASCAFAQEASVPKIEFQSVPDFLKLPPDMYFGEVAGVAVDSHKDIFVFSRGNTTGPAYGAAAAQLLEFSGHGYFLREIGHNLYGWSYAHSIKVDRNDNIWVADKGSDVVVKFNHDGRVAMVFGRKQEASDDSAGPLKHPNPPLPSASCQNVRPGPSRFEKYAIRVPSGVHTGEALMDPSRGKRDKVSWRMS